ncbi:MULTISPECIES: DUF4404 family protein [Pseudomonadaceae]|uniref:DUF4404 family protein n=1 Tax=Pseudomonadaceae TaxID=135621 RepID=UPI0008E2F519|nr:MULTISPECIES: DUF4404 family protein [Pseudomonas]MDU9400428.1 DUF4404 family protein [Pseudomonas sp. zfem003]WIF65479.1 DUF4404 family protein [Pseudomonas otitidis]SFA56013.1 protein of unknown function [Pseudomonas otitidis]
MSERLQQQLNELRDQLAQDAPMDAEERAHLNGLIRDIELKLANEAHTSEDSLVDGVNLAVERFELSHPTLAGTLRNIMQSLVSMGI